MMIKVTVADPRYDTLKSSRNLRLPPDPADFAAEIDLCESAAGVADALQRIVRAGVRPTIRSGGHCYEDFVVNNPGGTILDLSLLTADAMPGDKGRYRISPGRQLGEVYLSLYRRYGRCIPAGSCYAVGAGGHISGGGYGVLSRLHGLTVDWLSAVEILTVDGKGDVVLRHVDQHHESDLFRACRGAGGGNFGVMTGFLFEQLPDAPHEVISGQLSFDWKTMTPEKFMAIVLAYGDYFDKRGREPDTWGLFTILELTHADSGQFGIGIQFCNPNGRCEDLRVLSEFVKRFEVFGLAPILQDQHRPDTPAALRSSSKSADVSDLEQRFNFQRRLWLDATIAGSGSGGSGRAKYKSAYMKRNFSRQEAQCLYKYLTRLPAGVNLRGAVVSVDSYGGAVNKDGMATVTSICQRSSILKVQFQHYWHSSEEDAGRLQWMRDFYTELYSVHVDQEHAGTPYPGERYEGCYINYPDSDMLAHNFWPTLYYGQGELYPFLQGVKRRYDPNNIFHHAMSVRA